MQLNERSEPELDDPENDRFPGNIDFTTAATLAGCVCVGGLKWRRDDNGITAGRAIHAHTRQQAGRVLPL